MYIIVIIIIFIITVHSAILRKAINPGNIDDAEELVKEIMTLLEKACNKAMPKRRTREGRPPVQGPERTLLS